MLTVLASLAFLAAALVAVAAVKATWSQYRDVALGNIAALGRVGDEREFRVTLAALARRPMPAGQVVPDCHCSVTPGPLRPHSPVPSTLACVGASAAIQLSAVSAPDRGAVI